MSDLNEAVRLNPKWAEGLVERALITIDMKQPERALTDADRALGLDPKMARAY